MSVSVVVAAFNARKTIGDCVESLLAQTYPSNGFEVIVVDNASRDGTADVLQPFRGKVRLLHERTRGAAAARNAGVAVAGGELVAFIDADCVAHRDWLRNVVRPFADGADKIVGGRILALQPCNEVERFGDSIHENSKSIAASPPYVITMNCCFPLTVLNGLGGFNVSFLRSQDVDLSYRAVQAGYPFVYEHDAVVYHRHPSTLWGLFRKGFQHGRSSIHVFREHHDFLVGHGGRRRRFNGRAYRDIGSNLLRAARGPDRVEALCDAVFNLGKKVGKAYGSVKFGYLDL